MDSSASVEVIKSSLIERESNFVIFPRYDPFKKGSYILGKHSFSFSSLYNLILFIAQGELFCSLV